MINRDRCQTISLKFTVLQKRHMHDIKTGRKFKIVITNFHRNDFKY